MGLQQSKDELLYQQVSYGNVDGIKSLRNEGAGLEWIDREGKTPLIVACMNAELFNVARTLIDLGANVNAYRPGRHAGTPLHHAAKRGLEHTVKLLLSHGANALLMNDDCQTPLDVARVKGHGNVVRAIESHICLFSGWLRELYGPGFLEILAPQLLSRKVWGVVLPCGARKPTKPFKLELAIYNTSQDAQPRSVIALWKANMEEPSFNQSDPAVIITYNSHIPRRWRRRRGILSEEMRSKLRRVSQTRIKLLSANEGDKLQLQSFCNACKGIPQVMHSTFPFNSQGPIAGSTAPPPANDLDLDMAIRASLNSNPPEVRPILNASIPAPNIASSSHAGESAPFKGGNSKWEIHEVADSSNPSQNTQSGINPPSVIPSAPPIEDGFVDGPIHYPSVDSTPVDLSRPIAETIPSKADGKKEDKGDSSSCIICLDAPVEGACIPCGHMAGCMSCLNEIKGKNWGCPVCRTKIDQVVRLYAV